MSGPDLPAFASPTAVVRALPFMAHLPADVRNLILAGFEERTYRFGETVSTREDSAFVVVVEGEVRVIAERADRTEVSLGVLGAGQTSGERALVEDHPPGVTLRAASTAVRVLRLDPVLQSPSPARTPRPRRRSQSRRTPSGSRHSCGRMRRSGTWTRRASSHRRSRSRERRPRW